MTSNNVKNTSDLRKLLLETIEGVRKGKISHQQAQAISGLSARILQSARLDLDVIRYTASEAATHGGSSTSLLSEPSGQRKKRRLAN